MTFQSGFFFYLGHSGVKDFLDKIRTSTHHNSDKHLINSIKADNTKATYMSRYECRNLLRARGWISHRNVHFDDPMSLHEVLKPFTFVSE